MKFALVGAIVVILVAVLLIPVDDAFAADITTVEVNTFPFEITLVEEGTVIITSDIDRSLRLDPALGTILEIKAGEPYNFSIPSVMDSSNTDGWYILDLATGEYSIIHTVDPTPVTQLTINSLEIYEDGDYTRYHVIGDAPASTNLTFTMTKPNGSNGDYNGSGGTGQPNYNNDGLVSPNNDLVYGTWNLEICAAEHNMCVQESFTINQPASADLTISATQVEVGESVKIEWTNLHNIGDSQASGWVNQQFLPWEVRVDGEEYQFGTMMTASGSTNFDANVDSGDFTWTFYAHRHSVIDNTHYSGYKQIYENPIASVSWSVGSSTIQESTPDTTPPVITHPLEVDLTVPYSGWFPVTSESHPNFGLSYTISPSESFLSATDDVDGNINEIVCRDLFPGQESWITIYSGNPTSKFLNFMNTNAGSHPITCTATDSSGNVGSASFTIEITEATADTTPAVLSTDKESYIDTETIIVSGYSADIKRVQITKSDGSNILDAWVEGNTSVYTNNNGNYEYKIILPDSSYYGSLATYTGNYIVNIKDTNENILATKTIHISITANSVAANENSTSTNSTSTNSTSTNSTSTNSTSTNSTSTNSTSTNSTSTTTVVPTTVVPTTVVPTTVVPTPDMTTTAPVTPSTNKITVQTNRETYSQGNPIVLFGKVSTVVDNDLILLKISKDGSVIDTQSFKPTSKGEYTKLVISSGNLWDSTGNYRVDASYDGATSTNNFYFTSAITSTNSTSTTTAATTTTPDMTTTTPSDSSKDLKISLNKENIKVGETITIRALLDSIVSEQNVAVSVIDPNGKNVVSRTITVENSDQSSLQFKLVDNAISGTYIVKITSLMNGQTFTDSTEFTVVSSNSGVKIVSIEPTDQQGNAISTFAKNKMGFVKVVLSAENPINSLVTVNLFDSEFTSLGVGSFKTQLSGDHEIILSFFIPEFTTIGNGEIYTNVFSEWPSEGGIPLTGESSSTVILK